MSKPAKKSASAKSAPALTSLPPTSQLATLGAWMEFAEEVYARAGLALGQKAAFFQNTPHFVNMVEGSGRWGFSAIEALASDMVAAYREPKDIESNVRRKGLGGPSLL